MCGRYYVDDETAREIERMVRQVDETLRSGSPSSALTQIPAASYNMRQQTFRVGDIHPTEMAPVLIAENGDIGCKIQKWGFPGYAPRGKNGGVQVGADRKSESSGQVIFNARSESALSKRSFGEGIRHRRVVIPAAGFYEWNPRKEKNTFFRKDAPVLYMAGCYNRYEDGDRFVILTTAANPSMAPVHDRMPLILEKREVEDWLFDDGRTEQLLKKVPCLLERRTAYEQLSLF